MERIPLLAWIGIAIIIIIMLAINISLVAMWRDKTAPRSSMRQPRIHGFIGTAQDLAKVGKVMRDPFAGDRSQLDELSRLVHGLDKPERSNPDDTNANEETHQPPK